MSWLRYWNLSDAGARHVEQALELLRWAAPDHHGHILRHIQGVRYLWGQGCGENAIACTAGPHGRWIVLTSPPEITPLVELAVTLSHEARHHAQDQFGRFVVVEHRCVNCSSPSEQARDPIYQVDEWLRQTLYSALSPPQPSYYQYQSAPVLGEWPANNAPGPAPSSLLPALLLSQPSPAPEAVALAAFATAFLVGIGLSQRR